MAATALTAVQRRYLRGLCHRLKPLVLVGNRGITAALIKELDTTLADHELVKIKLAGDRELRAQQVAELVRATDSETVQCIGRTASLFRRNAEAPQLALPR